MSNEESPRVRPVSVQAAYLYEKVEKLKKEEAGVVEAARQKHKAKIAKLIATADHEVQKAFFAHYSTERAESTGVES